MSQPPYKQIEVASQGGEAVAMFTRNSREDEVITIEVRGGLSVRMDPRTLGLVAEIMEDDRLQLS